METIKTIVEGGKATAGPPLGPKLGPLGVNIGQIVSEINNKTSNMKGIDVPVTVTIDPKTKEFEIKVGTPSTASLIKKELKLKTAAGNQKMPVADVSVDRIIKIANVKKEGLLAASPKTALKELLGTCVSMGILVEGKDPRSIQEKVDTGTYDNKLNGSEELTFWDDAKIEERKKELKERIEAAQKKKEEEEAEETEETEGEEEKTGEKKIEKPKGEKPGKKDQNGGKKAN